ncbi:MAG: M28 family peptidase [Sphaerobacter sp.]|nr:M28 family peptidase [Sphaerobacter sp.]
MLDERLRAMDRHILGEIWTSDAAWRNLAYLCDDIGHRFAGSASERAGAEFLAAKMREYGLERVRLEEFPMASWERGECHLRLTAPLERELSAIAMPYCPSADIEAEVIDVGEGELPDFERLADQIPGKIVLTDAETNRPGERKSHRTDKFAWAIERGAVVCVFMNQNPGLLRITGSITGRNPQGTSPEDREAPIPGIGISYEAGKAIRRLAERGTPRLRIRTTNRTFASVSYNVIGEVRGTAYPNEVVLLGGHYDGHDVAQGAGDDGAGTITGLEAGRALAGLKGQLKRTVRIICFGSEEVGLLGAWHHAAQYDAQSEERLRFVLNLDGAGRGMGGQEQLTLSCLPELVPYFQRLGREMAYEFPVRDELNSHSDHFPFAVRGIPNGTLNSRDSTAGMIGRGWGHTEADTLDKVHLRGLQMSAILTARLAVRLAQDDAFPGRQRTLDEVREQLRAAGILERQERAGRFPPR